MSSSPEKSPRQELISYIANATEMTKEQSSKALSAVLDGITNLLKEGKKIPLIGFGTFALQERKATQVRNPRTGEMIDVLAYKKASFKAGIGLKEAVNPDMVKKSSAKK